MRILSHVRFRAALPILAAGLLLAAQTHAALAQISAPDASEVLRATPGDAERCSGPLGSLIPECKDRKTNINISTHNQLGDSPLSPTMRIPPANKPNVEKESPQQPVKAEGVTEFQRFVEASVGQVLPVFGANLFEGVPTTFAPLDRVPVTANYVIGPGDELLLRVWGQVNLDAALTVDRAGAVYIPQAGNVKVAGLEFQQLSSYLQSQLGRVFRNFDLSVTMGQLRSIQIFVVGQARRPGTYTVSSLSTLVNALFASGGPSGQGSMRRIQLKRGVEVRTEFDLYDLLLKGDKSKDAQLLAGDVVYIPPVGPQVAVAGSVKTAAVYELKEEKSIADLLQMTGGLTAVADAGRATLERIRHRSSRESIDLPLDSAGLATAVEEGDVLHVLTITPHIANVVTVRGNVANPGRFAWRPGMRLRELIPNKESLVTREYWKKRNLLGAVSPAESVAEGAGKPKIISIATEIPDINWSYAVIERQDPRDLRTEILPFHLGKLVLDRDESQNLETRPGDVITIFSQSDIRVAMAQQTRFVKLEGEFEAAGIYAVRPGETLTQLVQRAGGLTPQAYLYGAEFLRESTRIDQQRRLDQFIAELEQDVEHTGSNRLTAAGTPEESAVVATKIQSERAMLEKLRAVKATGRIVLSIEPSSTDLSRLTDLTLEDGDRFVVPSRPATVNVLGAVYNQNSFVYNSAGRVRDYLQQAGGPTRNADKGRLFLIRADGSVLPKPHLNTTQMHAGDSVVVPEAIFKGSALHGLRDWTQVFAQFALGAAAINVLK